MFAPERTSWSPASVFKKEMFDDLIQLTLKAYPHYDASKAINNDYDSNDDQMPSNQHYHPIEEPHFNRYLEAPEYVGG